MTSYAQYFYDNFLKAKGINSFTHKDIQKVTGANCPYSVLKDGIKPLLERLGYEITFTKEKKKNRCGMTAVTFRYFITKKDKENG